MTAGRASALTITELSPDDSTAAAISRLVAARQTELCSKVEGVSRRYCSSEAAHELVFDRGPGIGAMGAWRDGRLVAFLHGTAGGKFGFFPSTHHALDPDEADPTGVYGRMYAAIASRWLTEGVYVHDVEIPARDVSEQAWFDLGFGRRTCFAVRDTRTALTSASDGVEVRVATEDDLAEVVRLVLFEAEFRAAPALFADQGPLDPATFLATHREVVRQGGVHLVASRHGIDVGVLTIEPRSPAVLLTPDDAPYIGPTAVDPAARGRGVGHALVAAAVRWARSSGHEWLSVAYNPPNLMSRPFWQGCGFTPTGWKLARRLPESARA